jgi:hypothetical protein
MVNTHASEESLVECVMEYPGPLLADDLGNPLARVENALLGIICRSTRRE